MNIKLRTEAAPDGEQLNIREGMTIEDLVKERGPFKYDILLARRNGRDTDLTEQLEEGDSVAFLDMRNQSANLTYQRSLTFIYLMAVNEVFGHLGVEGADAEIDNSLNKGFFTRVRPSRFHKGTKEEAQEEIQQKLTEEVVRKIEDRMHEIVEMDIPFHRKFVTAEEGIRIWKEGGYDEKVKLLEEIVESEPDFMPAFFSKPSRISSSDQWSRLPVISSCLNSGSTAKASSCVTRTTAIRIRCRSTSTITGCTVPSAKSTGGSISSGQGICRI